MIVRRADVDDWRSVRAVRLAALADAPGAYITTLAEAERYPDERWRERIGSTPHFLAIAGDRPVGLATLIPDQPSPQLVGMWVSPDMRGTGIVDELIDAAAAQTVRQGHRELRLWVVVGNERAERAYARCGLRRTGRTQPLPGRPAQVEFEMSLSLPEPAPGLPHVTAS